MKSKVALGFIGLGLISLMGAANAIPITLIHTGTGSGSIGNTSFSNAAFTITEMSDNSLRQDCGTGGPCFFVNDLSASIMIGNLGTFNFVTPTRTFVDQELAFVGFARAGADGADLFDGPTNPAFSSYDFLTSLGPISGTGDLLQFGSPFDPVVTSGGILSFNDQSGVPATFQATLSTVSPIPEPATLLLLLPGILAGIGYRKRMLPRSA